MTSANMFPEPSGLSRKQLDALAVFLSVSTPADPSAFIQSLEAHLLRASSAFERNPLLNLELAKAVAEAFRAAASRWHQIPPGARPWLIAGMCYFTATEDEEPDFKSSIGFEDDAEVLNACLRLAGCDDLLVNPEEFDDA